MEETNFKKLYRFPLQEQVQNRTVHFHLLKSYMHQIPFVTPIGELYRSCSFPFSRITKELAIIHLNRVVPSTNPNMGNIRVSKYVYLHNVTVILGGQNHTSHHCWRFFHLNFLSFVNIIISSYWDKGMLLDTGDNLLHSFWWLDGRVFGYIANQIYSM